MQSVLVPCFVWCLKALWVITGAELRYRMGLWGSELRTSVCWLASTPLLQLQLWNPLLRGSCKGAQHGRAGFSPLTCVSNHLHSTKQVWRRLVWKPFGNGFVERGKTKKWDLISTLGKEGAKEKGALWSVVCSKYLGHGLAPKVMLGRWDWMRSWYVRRICLREAFI